MAFWLLLLLFMFVWLAKVNVFFLTVLLPFFTFVSSFIWWFNISYSLLLLLLCKQPSFCFNINSFIYSIYSYTVYCSESEYVNLYMPLLKPEETQSCEISSFSLLWKLEGNWLFMLLLVILFILVLLLLLLLIFLSLFILFKLLLLLL